MWQTLFGPRLSQISPLRKFLYSLQPLPCSSPPPRGQLQLRHWRHSFSQNPSGPSLWYHKKLFLIQIVWRTVLLQKVNWHPPKNNVLEWTETKLSAAAVKVSNKKVWAGLQEKVFPEERSSLPDQSFAKGFQRRERLRCLLLLSQVFSL